MTTNSKQPGAYCLTALLNISPVFDASVVQCFGRHIQSTLKAESSCLI